ncbi:MAG: hypothetical protein WD847_21665 [Pirellulales bacterium]
MNPLASAPEPERNPLAWRFRFRLATAFLAITLLCIFLALVVSFGLLGGVAFGCSFGLLLMAVAYRHRRSAFASGGVAVIAMSLVVGFTGGVSTKWIGRRTQVVVFTVVDVTTGQPVSDASVRLWGPYMIPGGVAGRTGMDGKIALTAKFPAIGSDRLFEKSGSIDLHGQFVEILADGYRPLQMPLDQFGATHWDLYGGPVPITVALTPNAPD